MKKYKQTFFFNSVKHALNGIKATFINERNFQIHVFLALLAILLGIVLKITILEFIIILLLIALVLGFELINTSIEHLADEVDLQYNSTIKKVKDAMAGAVLVLSIASVIIGLSIFLPKLIQLIFI